MSQRSIVEFNHDLLAEVDANPLNFIVALGDALNGRREEKDALASKYGVRVVARRHHSDDCRVVVGKGSFKQQFKIT